MHRSLTSASCKRPNVEHRVGDSSQIDLRSDALESFLHVLKNTQSTFGRNRDAGRSFPVPCYKGRCSCVVSKFEPSDSQLRSHFLILFKVLFSVVLP